MLIELELPIPVSVNQLTHNNNSKNGGQGGRSKTPKAKTWESMANLAAGPYVSKFIGQCTRNIKERASAFNFRKKDYNLHMLHNKHKELSYTVVYKYWFAEERHKLPRDVFNYEKQLSDFLCNLGFMLDDSFIDSGTVIRAGTDKKNPRVEIFIVDNEKGVY